MFKINSQYSKKDIYEILDVPKEQQRGAWDTGYRKYNDDIYLFVNIGVEGRTGHNYDNHWDGSNLVWYGKTKSNINQPIIQYIIGGKGKVHIFTRTSNKEPFTYNGVGKKLSIQDTSPIKVTWTFEPTLLLNPKEAWKLLLKNAKKFYNSQGSYISPRQRHLYKIIKVADDFIRIKRLSVQTLTEVDLTYHTFEGVILRINRSHGFLKRSEVYKTVIVESAIVWLLPMLDWDNDYKHVLIDKNEGSDIPTFLEKKFFQEAKDDTEYEIITRELRRRRGQNKLRENLFYLYRDKCCVTGFGIKDLLHACHIIPHSESGINSSTNALLFRSDIHDLFDSNLIGINPKTMKVMPSKELYETEYDKLKGVKISDRIDGIRPNFQALAYRWDIFNSIK